MGRRGEGHPDEEGRDGLADADSEGNAGDEDRDTDGPHHRELVRVRLQGPLEPRRPVVGQKQERDDERERDADGGRGGPEVGPAGDERGRYREIHRDEQVLEHERPEQRVGLVVGDPAEVDERLRDDGRRGDVDDAGDQEGRERVAEQREPEHETGTEIDGEVDGASPGDAAPALQ